MKLFWYFFSYVGGIFTVCLHWTDTTVFHQITKRFLFFEAHDSRNNTFFPRSLNRCFATLNLLFCNDLFGLCLLFFWISAAMSLQWIYKNSYINFFNRPQKEHFWPFYTDLPGVLDRLNSNDPFPGHSGGS